MVAFGGLSLLPTSHHFVLDGRELFTWCAWDTLFLPSLLKRPAVVRSTCPVTGVEVRLEISPDGVTVADPADLGVSFPPPEAASAGDITGSFCCQVHFLAGAGARAEWLRRSPESIVLSLSDAFELGRLATVDLREPRAQVH